jgi:DNA modification methylase
MHKLEIVYREASSLKRRPGNPRTHDKKQIGKLAKSLQRFGFTNPVLIDDDGFIIAGHGRAEAAALVGMTEVPTVRLSDMSQAEIRAYVIADNRLAEQAGWAKELLATEFKFLAELEEDFDLTDTGFELAEIDAFLSEEAPKSQRIDPDDAVPETADFAVTRRGDIWQIGCHRLTCGDATLSDTFEALLGDELATMVFTDPPFNVPIKGHVSGLGRARHREFEMGSGEMSRFEFTSFLARTFSNLAKASTDGSLHFHFMDWRHLGEILEAGAIGYNELKNLCVWAKTSGGMGSLYRSAHELVLVFKSGAAPHINNVELGKNGRYRSSRANDLAMHPTVKPVALVADAILDCSRRKDIVLDCFAGSGTTLVAAQKARRRGYGIELDPLYCDVIIRRLQSLFKLQAVLIGDGRTFEQIASERSRADEEQAA